VDYERAPQYQWILKKNTCYLYRNTYKTLDDLNQDEMRLGGLRINPTTNSSVTYINNIKLRKIKEKRNSGKRFTRKSKITNLSWSPNEKKIAFQILQNWRILMGCRCCFCTS
jgi:hypothetical protein